MRKKVGLALGAVIIFFVAYMIGHATSPDSYVSAELSDAQGWVRFLFEQNKDMREAIKDACEHLEKQGEYNCSAEWKKYLESYPDALYQFDETLRATSSTSQ